MLAGMTSMCRFMVSIGMAAAIVVNAGAADRLTVHDVDLEAGIAVPLVVNGQAVLGLIDTGATSCAFDPSVIALGKVSRRDETGTPDGPVSVECFSAPRMQCGSIDSDDDEEVMGFDLAPMREALNLDVSCVIGMRVLRNYAIQVDSDSRTFRVLDSPVAEAGLGDVMPIEYRRGIPCVMASVQGRPFVTMVDTGSSSTSLDSQIFDRVEKEGGLTSDPEHYLFSVTVAGPRRARVGLLRSLKLGEISLDEVKVISGRYNILGANSLAAVTLTCDFPRGVAYIKRAKGTPAGSVWTGLSVRWVNRALTVMDVAQPSDANVAGFQAGDVIERVAGRDASRMHRGEWSRLWRESLHTKVELQVRRGDATQTIEMLVTGK